MTIRNLRLIAPLFALLLCPFPLAGRKKAEPVFDVYLLIGQSNMAGRGELLDSDREVMDGVFLLNGRDEVEPAKQPLNRYSTVRKNLSLQGYNLGGPFADIVHKATGRPILLVVNPRSGTSARLWKSDAPRGKWAETDDLGPVGEEMPQLFEEAVRRARIACKHGELKAILWHQGEADAHETYAPLWPDKMSIIAEELRSRLGVQAKDVPFIAGETNRAFKRSDLINREIHTIPRIIPNSSWVSSEGCGVNRDKLHFSRQGIFLLGQRYAEKVLQMVYGFSVAASEAACTGQDPVYSPLPAPESGLYTLCDFDHRAVEFTADGGTFSVVGNPRKGEAEPSAVVGRMEASSEGASLHFSSRHPLDFTAGKRELRIRILPPKAGCTVSLQLGVNRSKAAEGRLKKVLKGVEEVTVQARLSKAGAWEELRFDLAGVQSNFYQDFTLSFDGKGTWYFDDIVIPDDDGSALSLFRRVAPPLLPDPSQAWMSNSIANPDILTPEESPDGNWWLFVRGGDGKRSHLGLYTQKAEGFNPLGPWDYYEGNPVIPAGWFGDEDAHQAIDPAPVMGDDGRLYLYYKGIDKSLVNRVLLAESTDGYHYTKVEKPWKEKCGVADVVRWNGHYYLYVSQRIYRYDDPLSGEDATVTTTLTKGGGPDNCDWYSINGGKLFRVRGTDRWFLAYQAGANNTDFPERFHVAYSDDLLHWTKVDNPQPFFTRGARGEWDQGAIWAPALFEYGDSLYLYYEGWGREGEVQNRDKMYFLPGHSQVGIASCKTADFLAWCGL